MINGKISPGETRAVLPVAWVEAAVNTAISIALENSLLAPGDAVAGNLNITPKAHNRRQVKDVGHASDGQEMISCRFDAFTQDERNSPLVRDDGEGFVGSVEEEYGRHGMGDGSSDELPKLR